MEEKKNEDTLLIVKDIKIKKSRPLLKKIISITVSVLGIVVVIAIIGGGALLAGHVWNPSWNPFRQKQPLNTSVGFANNTTIENIFKK